MDIESGASGGRSPTARKKREKKRATRNPRTGGLPPTLSLILAGNSPAGEDALPDGERGGRMDSDR